MNGKNKGKLVEGEGEEEKIDEDREQWGKALQIRKKLRQYCKSFLFPENTIVFQKRPNFIWDCNRLTSLHTTDELLNLQISTNNLPQPREHDISVLRKWLERPKLGNYPLPSRDKDSWSAQHEDDLFALQRKPTSDLFSRWMIWSCVPYLHRKLLRNFTRPLPTRETPEPSLPQTQHTILNSGGNTISRTKISDWFSRAPGTIKEATRSDTFRSGKTLVAECSDNAEILQDIVAPRTTAMIPKI